MKKTAHGYSVLVALLITLFIFKAQAQRAPSTFNYSSPVYYAKGVAIATNSPVADTAGTVKKFSGSFGRPSSFTFDAAGNMFVSDWGNGQIYKVATSGTKTLIASSLNNPCGIAVDPNGNIYEAEQGTNTIKKLTYSNGSYSSPSTYASGFSSPQGIILDASGNLYVADQGNRVVKKIATNGNVTTIGSGFSGPSDIKFDAAGNLYVADYGSGKIFMVATNGTTTLVIYPASLGYNIWALAVDAFSNIYYTDINNNKVWVLPKSGATPLLFAKTTTSAQAGLGLDPAGNLYVSDFSSTISEITTAGSGATSYSVSPSLPAGLSLNTTTGEITGTPTALTAASNYKVTATNLIGSNTTTLSLAVSMLAPGNFMYPSPYGFSLGNNLALTPAETGSVTVIGAGQFANPEYVTEDATGNIFVADLNNRAVKKIAKNGTITTIASNLNYPTGIVVDANGNIYVAEQNGADVKKISYTNGSYGSPTTYATGVNYPQGLALDASGNLYIADNGNNRLTVVAPNSTVSYIYGSFNSPRGITIDPFGNVYVADYNNNALKKITPSGVLSTVVSGGYIVNPWGVALDATGNIYVSNWGNNYVQKINTSGIQNTINTGLNNPSGIALDASGNVALVTYGGSQLQIIAGAGGVISNYSISPSLPSGMNINATTGVISGTPTAVSPSTTYVITATNTLGSVTDTSYFSVITAFSYSQSVNKLIKDSTILPIIPNVVDGLARTYSISPSLPAGLSINASTGVITGKPTAVKSLTNFSVTGTTASGYAQTATLPLEVFQVAPSSFSYNSPTTFVTGSATAITPEIVPVAGAISITGIGTGIARTEGLGIDPAGNIYVSDVGTTPNRILKITPSGTQTTVSTNTNRSNGIIFNSAGKLLTANVGTNTIINIDANGAATTFATGLNNPMYLAYDTAGNMYSNDLGTNNIKKITTTGVVSTYATGFNQPYGVAVDGSGNLFVAEAGTNNIIKVAANGTKTTFATGLNGPRGITFDAVGNLFVAEWNNGGVRKITPSGQLTSITTGLNSPFAIVVDSAGEIYVGSIYNSGWDAVVKITFPGSPATNYSVSPALPAGLSINSTTGVIGGTATAASANSSYTITASNAGGSTTSIVNLGVYQYAPAGFSYAGPNYVASNAAITPISPVKDNPGAITVVGTIQDSHPIGLTIDQSGNTYVTDNTSNKIFKYDKNGNRTTFATGFNSPRGLAIDNAGNIFVVDYNTNSIKKVTAAGVVSTFASGFNNIQGLATDISGNVYVSNPGAGQIVKITPSGTQSVYVTQSQVWNAGGLAIDQFGNLFAIDNNVGYLKKITPSGVVTTLMSTPLYNLFGAGVWGLAVDATGNIFMTTTGGSGAVWELPAFSSTPIMVSSMSPNFDYPNGIAVTPSGDLMVAVYNKSNVVKISQGVANATSYSITPALPAGLSFNVTTGVVSGTPSATATGKNYTVTATNTAGTATGILSLAVAKYAPGSFSYSTPNLFFTGTAITALNPVSVSSTTSTIATGFNGAQYMVRDTAGNVYVSDYNNGVVKKVANGGAVTTIASGLNYPTGIVLDSIGNIYVAEERNNDIKMLPFNNGTFGTATTYVSGLNWPQGLALDNRGYFYVTGTIYGVNAGRVMVIAPDKTTTNIDAFTTFPKGIALDVFGNMYVANGNAGTLVKVNSAGVVTTIATGLNWPWGVALDIEGNIFVANNQGNSITKITLAGVQSTINSNITNPSGLFVDASGNIYTTTGGSQLVKLPSSGGVADKFTVSPALPSGLSINSTTGIISGTPTLGVTPTNYTVTATNSVGNAIANFSVIVGQYAPSNFTYINPDTLLSAVTRNPTTVTTGSTATIGSGYTALRNVAADANGNVYAVDNTANLVKKIAFDGTVTTVATGFNSPYGVALDTFGNVYVGDQTNNVVKKVPFSNGTYGTPVAVGTGLNSPAGVALDATGNIYVADANNNAIKKIQYSNGTYGSVVTIATGFNKPQAVAVDVIGNVYVADYNNNAIKKIPYNNGTYGSAFTIGSGFNKPTGISVDVMLNVYVSDNGNSSFKKIAGNGTVTTLKSGVTSPYGVAVDATGNVYMADATTNTVKVLYAAGGILSNYSITPALPLGLVLNPTTGTISGTPLAAINTMPFTVSANNGGGSAKFILTLTTYTTSTWTGTANTDWSNSGNWLYGLIPDVNSSVVVPDTLVNQPILSTDASIQALTLNGTILLNGHSLSMARITTGKGSVQTTGTAAIIFAPALKNTLGKLVVNSGALTVSGALAITKELDVNAGTLNTGGNITLKSTSVTNTAIVGPVGGTINGVVNVERYIPASWRAYRDVAPEVYGAGSIFANWQEGGNETTTGIFITGTADTMALSAFSGTATSANPTPAADGLDYSIKGTPSAFNFVSGVWSAITNTKTTSLDPFTGYRVLVRGARDFNLFKTPIETYGVGELAYYSNLRMYDATTLRASGGQLVAGNVTYTTSGATGTTANGTAITSTGAALNSTPAGFSMVANPYVCPVLWGNGSDSNSANTVYGKSANVNGSFWYLAPVSGTSGSYLAYNALTGSAVSYSALNYTYSPAYAGTSGYIQPGQAVFVQTATTGSPSVQFTEASKATAANLFSVFGTVQPLSKIYITLGVGTKTGYSVVDGAALAFSSAFGNKVYGPQDAIKVNNPSDNLSITDKGVNLSIDGRLPATGTETFMLKIAKPSSTTCQLRVDARNYISEGLQPMLYDAFKNTTTAIDGVDSVVFKIDTAVAASYTNRFSIYFMPTALPLNSITANASIRNKVATISWSTVGEKQVASYQVEKSTDGKLFTSVKCITAKNTANAGYSTTDNSVTATTYYRIKVLSSTGAISYSNVVKLSADNLLSTCSIYPNPLKGSNVINISLANVNAGKYTVSVFSALGVKVSEHTISHEGVGTHAISINNALAAGVYTVTIVEAATNQLVHQATLAVNY